MIDVTQGHIENRSSLAQAIVNTVREPLLVLDSDLRVVVASRSYCQTFQTTAEKKDACSTSSARANGTSRLCACASGASCPSMA